MENDAFVTNVSTGDEEIELDARIARDCEARE